MDIKKNGKQNDGNVDEGGGARKTFAIPQEGEGQRGGGQHGTPKFIIFFFMTLAY